MTVFSPVLETMLHLQPGANQFSFDLDLFLLQSKKQWKKN